MGMMASREKKENQAKGSEAFKVPLERWGLQDFQDSLEYQDLWAKKETLEYVQSVMMTRLF